MKNLNFDIDVLTIKYSFWKARIHFSDIESLKLYEVAGDLIITYKSGTTINVTPVGSVSLMAAFSDLKIMHLRSKRQLIISLFRLEKDLDALSYYSFIDDAKKNVPKLEMEDRTFSADSPVFLFNADKDNMLVMDCPFCNAEIRYVPPSFFPYLVQCPSCGKKVLESHCPKCGLGGFVIPKNFFKDDRKGISLMSNTFAWKAISDRMFEEKPHEWYCGVCKNNWRIPAFVYESEAVKGQTAIPR